MEGGERYAEFPPPPELAPWVRVVWTYAAPKPSDTIQRIAPDGCPELILDIGAPYEELGPDGVWRLQPRAIFAGQMTQPIAIRPVGPVELVAIRFHPDGARDWLGHTLSGATDQRLDVVERIGHLKAPSGDPEAQAPIMTDFLDQARRRDGWRIDPTVRAEVEAIAGDRATPVRSAAEQRALQRRFLDRVGISPRTLRSITRFRRVFDHVVPGDPDAGWLEAGLEAGYFDQPRWRVISAASWAAPLPNGRGIRSNWPAPSRRKPTSRKRHPRPKAGLEPRGTPCRS